MKNILICFIIIFCSSHLFAKKMLTDWTINYYASGAATIKSSCYDSDSNLYITGWFSDTLRIDTFERISQDKEDAFVAKINKFKKCEWLTVINGTRSQKGVSVSSEKGIVYWGITFQDSIVINNSKKISWGIQDIIYFRLGNSGEFLWSNLISSFAEGLFPNTIRVNNKNGNLISILNIGFPNTYTYLGNDSIYNFQGTIVRILDSFGNQSNIKYINLATAVSIAKSGESIAGVTPDQIPFLIDSTPAIGAYNGPKFVGRLFVAALNDTGKCKWVRTISGANPNIGSVSLGSFQGVNITSDADSNVYISGYIHEGDAYFHNGFVLYSNFGATMGFVAKYNKVGDLLWAKNAGACELDAIDIDSFGNVYTCGMALSGFVFADDTLNPTGSYPLYICKFSNNGMPLWGYINTGSSGARATSLHVTSPDHLIITGVVGSSACIIDTITLANNPASGGDPLVVRLFMDTSIYNPLSINTNYSISNTLVYPNPTNTIINVKSNSLIKNIKIINANGQVIVNKNNINANECKLSISNIPGGIYYLQILEKNYTYYQLINIQH
jgi:hypothetical protein